MKALNVEGVSLAYEGGHVLEKVSFSVNEGEFFMILGPNGAGKSTLLKLITGIRKPQAGKIEILKRSQKEYSARDIAKTISLVSQHAPTDFPFTVAETILMGRAPHLGLLKFESSIDYSIAEEAMAFTEVDQFAGRRLSQLSGGERQRVMIARAICQEPRIMLLDEPTTALDPAHQLKIMDLMEKLRRDKNTTIVMVSHDLNIAAMYADRLLMLKNGCVVVTGSPSEVFTPENLKKSYECDLVIDKTPFGKIPRVMLYPEKFRKYL